MTDLATLIAKLGDCPKTEKWDRFRDGSHYPDKDYDVDQTEIRADAALLELAERLDVALDHERQEVSNVAAERSKTQDEHNRRMRDVRRLSHERDEALDRAEAAEARVAELEKELDAVRQSLITRPVLLGDAEMQAEVERLRDGLDTCGRQCPACVDFTTVFTMPKVEYAGCLRKQSDCNKLMDRHAAPLGQPCPYGGWAAREEEK